MMYSTAVNTFQIVIEEGTNRIYLYHKDVTVLSGGVTVGWTHYLAFDLFIGIWIARDADAKGFARWIQAPILFATFMAGPVGLLVWLIVREHCRRPEDMPYQRTVRPVFSTQRFRDTPPPLLLTESMSCA